LEEGEIIMRKLTVLFLGVLLVAFLAVQANAFVIQVGEFGYGVVYTTPPTTLPYTVGQDPGPGGLANALIYTLPSAVVPGDIVLLEPNPISQGQISDIIRFTLDLNTGAGLLVFYSDSGDPSVGDTGFPGDLQYSNYLVLNEVGPDEGLNGYWGYYPTPDQPGYMAGCDASYNFISGVAVPLPPSVWLLGSGLLGLVGLRRKLFKA
jgi:hypothetical protein